MTSKNNNIQISNQKASTSWQGIFKSIGPGLLLASSSIGTSHLILATRAGAHHGMIFFWIILLTLILKYPFYQYGPRYANATGTSLLEAYKKQGKWALLLFMGVLFINMFAVVGAISAVCAGLIKTMIGSSLSMPVLIASILIITGGILLLGRFSILDNFNKCITLVLLITISIAFFAVLFKGPIDPIENFKPSSIWQGAGLTLTIGLLGWMPSGMEASTFNSIWVVEKIKSTNYKPTMKEGLWDFNLGYFLTVLLSIVFLVIGAFTVYGTGQILAGNPTQFSNKLINIFTSSLGNWSYWIIAICAFATIYGTLITAWDAFARGWVRCMLLLKEDIIDGNTQIQQVYLNKYYKILVLLIGIGGFILFTQFAKNMLAMLDFSTVIAFLLAPIIAVLNLRAITSKEVSLKYRPSKYMLIFSYIGLVFMLGFSIFYLSSLFN